MSDTLKPCPFCGGNGARRHILGLHRVTCATCDAGTSWSGSPREAIIAWNRRAADDRLATLRADLLPPRIEDAVRTIREEVDRFAHVLGEEGQFVVRTRAALATLADCAVTARRGE